MLVVNHIHGFCFCAMLPKFVTNPCVTSFFAVVLKRPSSFLMLNDCNIYQQNKIRTNQNSGICQQIKILTSEII